MTERDCKKCGQVLPVSCFHRHKSCKGGYNSVCKECRVPVSEKQYALQTQEYRILKRAVSRARRRGLDCTIELEDIVIPDICPVLGKPLAIGDPKWTPSIDRIDSTKGYVKGNVRIISSRANTLKNTATEEELEALLADVKKTHR